MTAWNFCTSGAAVVKAGYHANATITASGTALLNWYNEAASEICNIARVDLDAVYSSLTATGKEILQQYCTASVAQNIIQWDQTGYLNREVTMLMNALENQRAEVKTLIKEDNVKTYLGAT